MANTFKLTIVTPDGKKIVDEAYILNVVTSAGALGILANHLPLVSVIEISHLNYKKYNDNGQLEMVEMAISGGILNVSKEEVIVLAETFETKDEIDVERAERSKQRALDRINSHDDNINLKRAELSLKRALSRLSL